MQLRAIVTLTICVWIYASMMGVNAMDQVLQAQVQTRRQVRERSLIAVQVASNVSRSQDAGCRALSRALLRMLYIESWQLVVRIYDHRLTDALRAQFAQANEELQTAESTFTAMKTVYLTMNTHAATVATSLLGVMDAAIAVDIELLDSVSSHESSSFSSEPSDKSQDY